jgi:hypothetical protein
MHRQLYIVSIVNVRHFALLNLLNWARTGSFTQFESRLWVKQCSATQLAIRGELNKEIPPEEDK